MNILERTIGFLAPHICVVCGAEGAVLCTACIGRLPALPSRCYRCTAPTDTFQTCPVCQPHSPLIQVWAATPYAGPAKEVIHALKFARAAAAAESIAAAITATVPAGSMWVITHAPTVYSRARQRGYDQAQCIARHLAQHTSNTYAPLLARQGTQRQLGQSRAVRRAQMAAAFRVSDAMAVRDKDVLVVDDVLTTGSTLEAAAHALQAAGARSVRAAVFAAA